MNKYKTISEYKEQAKESLLGNYGIAIGSFVLIFAIYYCISSLLGSAASININVSANGNNAVALSTDNISVFAYLVTLVCDLAAKAIYSLFFVGFLYIIRDIARGNKPKINDVFYAFKNHPDKVLIIFLIREGVSLIAFAPFYYYLYIVPDGQLTGKVFFMTAVFLLVGSVISAIAYLNFMMSYFVYLEDSSLTAMECIRMSIQIMRGSKMRMLYLIISMIGYGVLGILSLGIGFLFIIPYFHMTTFNTFEDIRIRQNVSSGAEYENRI